MNKEQSAKHAELCEHLAVIEDDLTQLIPTLYDLIDDDYRAAFDDDKPSMPVTIGFSDDASSWNYQTGDNSFSGGAYGFPHWAVTYLYRGESATDRDAICSAAVADLMQQIEDTVA